MFKNITEIKQANKAAGFHWFTKATIRFWRTKVVSRVYHGQYFITSEPDVHGNDVRYTIRKASADGSIDTCGEFRGYASKLGATQGILKFHK